MYRPLPSAFLLLPSAFALHISLGVLRRVAPRIPHFSEATGPLRILHVIASHRWTGAAEPAVRLASAEHRVGHDVLFSCTPGWSLESKVGEFGVPFDNGVEFDRSYLPWRKRRDFVALRALIRRFRPETVHVHLTHDHVMTALAMRGDAATRLVRSFHREEPPRTNPLFRRLAVDPLDGAVAVSSSMGEAIVRAYGWDRERVLVERGHIDTQQFHPGPGERLRAKWSIPADAMVFGVVSRLRETRGIPWLLDAAAKALPQLPDARLVICGRGTWLDEMLARIAVHPARERIHYAGYVEGDDLLESYRAFDASLLLKPGNDGTCRAALESMASACPVIGGDMGALRDLLGASNAGWLAPIDDVDALAGIMVDVARNADGRRRRGSAARAFVATEFSEEGAARRMVEFYGRLPAVRR